MRRSRVVYFLFLIAFCNVSFSQVYPVQLSAQLIPPYSGYLPDYADPGSEKLKIIIQFNDFTTPQYNLRLRIEIKGNGFSLVTKQLFNPPPLTVQPGVPLLLSGADLAPYLNSNNLDFIGINQTQYEQRMALPEGYYSICIKTYDYYNPGKIQVSNESCTQAWFTLSDPPFLNLPQCGKNIAPQTPQNILFQWTPMNFASPNSAMNTEYEFALWEVRPDSSANPNQIVLSVAPIFSTTTNLTLINYGITEPPLNLYMKYVWRVRVIDITGRDWFKNSGYSQICTFVYGNASTVLGNSINLNLTAQGISHRLGKCTWNTQSLYTNYLLQVRKEGTENWFDYNCTTGSEKVNNLEPNTNYEARVRGEGMITSDWSNTATFNTFAEPNYSCNDPAFIPDPLPPQPLPVTKAITGLIIQTGQFEVFVTQIFSSGPAGWYSGKGYAKVFGALPLSVQFNNIYIDDNNHHQQGVIKAMTQGIGNWVHQWDVKNAEENGTYVNGTIDSIYVNGNQICVKIQGHAGDSCFAMPADQNVVVVRDDNGNQWTINVGPPPTITGPTNYFQYSDDGLDASDSTIVVFEESPNKKFGFDAKKYTAWIPNYELIKLKNGKNYFVPYAGIGEFESDEVYAAINIIEFNASKLSFKSEAQIQLSASVAGNPNLYKVTVPHQAKSIYAWYDGKKVGKLNVISLKAIAKKLVIVPVGANINTTNLQNDLNKIFSQANVTWNVTVKPNYIYNLGNDGLEAADATLMTKYSTEMRALRDAYKKFDSLYDKEAYYVFVVNNFTDPNVKGYMVRGRALGFVASTSSATEITRVIAHELAHGAFGLGHTFPAIAKNSSDNLMDYKTGTELGKVQWDLIENGKFELNWFDEEEDAQYSANQSAVNVTLFETLKLIKRCYNTNSTMPITQFGEGRISGYRTEKAFIAGIQYDYIFLYKESGTNTPKTTISPKNNLTSEEKTAYYAGSGMYKPYGLIKIDNNLYIEVPSDRRVNMEYYLTSPQGKNLILFVNGYRPNTPSLIEKPNSLNKVYSGDVNGYWAGIDADFMNRIGTKNAIYADGHHSVATANHLSQANFLASMATSFKPDAPTMLNTVPNVSGYNVRYNYGKVAAYDMISKLNSNTIQFDKNNDTLDIVAHSMGYAYAVGIIDALTGTGVKFGRFYIIAPENACSGNGVDYAKFTEVWQYGSNLGEPNADPLKQQDGVAPQCAVPDIVSSHGKTKNGRVFIPNGVEKDFLKCHTIGNYKWIFTERKLGMDGYVKPR
jgi:hypothetical protein